MKAAPEKQQRLLDVQAIDTRLDQIQHARTHLPQLAEIADLEDKSAVLSDEHVRVQTAHDDVQRELRKSEMDVQQVRDRAARDEQRLNSGQGSAKDLQALQHELQSLARRQNELEDIELEVMERAEAIESDLSELQAGRERLAAQLGELELSRDLALGKLDAEADEISAPREGLVGEVGEELIALYEKIRATHGGLAAAPLRQRRCGGCQLELNAVDLNTIRAAADDEVIRCEECRRILVRTPESGL
ncbi:MAG: C4-type zinc ribbon domain-containing protein [Actinomycetia bacterium]|nr:C4-type zinc ribbon domain-containing protein [Actinomycetes bacterium]